MGEIDIKRQAPNVARMKMLGPKFVRHFQDQNNKDATNKLFATGSTIQ
jgi:tryptophan synthase beta subunit